VLVSATMIAQARNNSWSELLTSICLSKAEFAEFQDAPEVSGRIVSNPAQHLRPWPVMVDLQKVRNERRFSGCSGCLAF
jgi:hypothetical protein